jgi:hypothetical protein
MTSTPPEEPFGSEGLPSFPTSPGGSPSSGVPQPDLTQPSSVRTAVRLMLVGAAISALSVIITVLTLGSFKDDLADQAREADASVTQADIDTAVAVGISFVVFIGVVGVALWLWMAWKNGQGRSWARIVASVLGALNVIFTLLSFAGGQTEPVTLVLSLVNLVLAVVILVLLWRKESTAFYEAVSRSHMLQ